MSNHGYFLDNWGKIVYNNLYTRVKEGKKLEIKFNSKSEKYKNPFGAVKDREEVTFCVFAKSGVFINNVKIVFEKDEKFFCEHYFNYDGFENEYHKFSKSFSFNDTGIYYYYFVISTENGEIIGKNDCGNFKEDNTLPLWQLTVYDKEFQTPKWAKGKIMYQIFPDRFKRDTSYKIPQTVSKRKIHENWEDIPEYIYDTKNYIANDFFLGNLDGIISRLDYLKSLNVGIIYLNPIFESSVNHRYSTANYKNIDPYLGTNETFSTLCKEAKKRGIAIILDGVFSHTGDDSIYFNKYSHYDSLGAYNSDNSPYRSWYNFTSYDKSKYECWWGFETLPNVNELDESYLDFITNKENGVVKFWNDFGIMGWRLDVADELPDGFIDKFRESVKKINPDSLILGEVWEDATTKESYGVKRRYLLGKQLDSVMNYPFKNLILDYALKISGKDFLKGITDILENYPQPAIDVLMNFVGTHDTMRAITALNNKAVEGKKQGTWKMSKGDFEKAKEKLKMCVFLQFTLPGIPCIYYGDEVGLQGFKDPYNRLTFPYGKEDEEILEFHKKITSLKTKYKEDFSSPLKPLYGDDTAVSFKRGKLVFVTNKGKSRFFEMKNIEKLVFSKEETVFNKYGLLMPPMSYAVVKLKED